MNTLHYLLGIMLVVLFVAPAEAVQPTPQPTAGKAVSVGDFSVVPLFDGAHGFAINLFKGADEAAMQKAAGGLSSIPGAFMVYLIKRGKDRYLVDAGNGTLRQGRTGQLPQCLKEANTAPAEIGKIFITHMHGDHIGGLVKDGKAVFPKAQVYVARAEYDYWTSEEAMRLAPEGRRGLFPLVRDVLRILEQDKLLAFFAPGDVVAPEVASVDLAGHTPGHAGFLLASRGKKLLFVGDLLHGAALQMPRPDITVNFDVDQAAAKEMRLRVFKQLAEDTMPIAGAHLPFPGIGLVRSDGGGYKLEVLK